MRDEDVPTYQHAVQLANAGQTRAAYDQFCVLQLINDDIEVLFWLVKTTPYPAEAERALAEIAAREPEHPLLSDARVLHERKLQQMQRLFTSGRPGPVLLCPYCGARAPTTVKSKISTGGWVVFAVLVFACLPLCWLGLLINEDYRLCGACGMKLG